MANKETKVHKLVERAMNFIVYTAQALNCGICSLIGLIIVTYFVVLYFNFIFRIPLLFYRFCDERTLLCATI